MHASKNCDEDRSFLPGTESTHERKSALRMRMLMDMTSFEASHLVPRMRGKGTSCPRILNSDTYQRSICTCEQNE